jgi:hypothetical protein
MALNLAALEAAYEKVDEAVARLKTLIADGAPTKDIADAKAVLAEVVLQFQQVVGIKPMP